MSSDSPEKLLADVDAYCQELRPSEELCYVEHRFNEQTIELAKKYNLLGMPVPVAYGGHGADAVTYARALAQDRARRDRRADVFLGPDVDRPIPDHALRECRSAPALFARFGARGENPGLWPDRAGRGQQSAGNDDDVSAGRRTLPAKRREVFDFRNRRHRRCGRRLWLSRRDFGTRSTNRNRPFIVDTAGTTFEAEDLHAKPGMFTANTGMFQMTDHPVPVANLLGEEGNGFRVAMGTLVSGRLSVAAGCLGVIEDCLAEALSYAQTRVQHGKLIGRHQLVQEHLACIEMDRAASDALVFAQPRPRPPATPRRRHNAGGDGRFLRGRGEVFCLERGLGCGGSGRASLWRSGWSIIRVGRRSAGDVAPCAGSTRGPMRS